MIASFIDHTLLRANATEREIETLCKEALQHHFFSVCTNSFWSPLVHDYLKGSTVKTCAVVGFPLGAQLTSEKIHEAETLVRLGVQEIDMVMNIGAFKSGLLEATFDDMKSVVRAAESSLVKVIIETAYLTADEMTRASELVMASGAHFVKTSTGFASRGASLDDIQIIKKIVGTSVQIKASGGIKELSFARALIEAGANRIGSSQSVSMVKEEESAVPK